ncbi:hypothetical protein F4680DRAFT_447784 [Xylaria scruposa]|nr:hypothetical protein F4680DRAFT_447784 [Xylaria scruposa]
MDPLTAVGLASNVVQFVHFTSDLIHTAVKIHKSSIGCTDDVLTLDSLYQQLSAFNDGFSSGSKNAHGYLNGRGNESTQGIPSFHALSLLCKSDCEKLLSVVDTLKKQHGPRKHWQSFRTALRMVWEKDKIEELEKRLNRIQTTMTLQICTIASHAQETRAHYLEQLQTESNRLQLDQSVKLGKIMTALDCIEQNIEQVKCENKAGTALMRDLESLEQQISKLSLSQDVIAEEQAILKSLSFKTRPVRHASIPEAYQKTFRWVYHLEGDNPTSATFFAKWLKSGDGVFWVSGKPGSGKSTFMKFVADEPTTLELLSEWSGSEKIIIASHYFWSAGTAMQKSQEGLLRTLLYEIFRQLSELIIPVCGNRRPGPGEESESGFLPWTLSNLYEILRKVATRETSAVRFCFFIDGLDEYDGNHSDICQALGDLAKSSDIKICLSSRPWNEFEQAFGDNSQSKLYMQDLTRNDILQYIRWRLYEHPRWPSLATKASQGNWLVEEIEKRARGVFLWVFLVARLLREGLTNRDSFSDICRRLESFPLELEAFFRQILESVEPFYHRKMSTTLQMAIVADEPLHAMAYDFHDQDYDDEGYVFHLPISPYTLQEEEDLKERMIWWLNSRTRGLLEINRETGTIDFLHRTVRDFLKTREMLDFIADKAPPQFNLSLFLLKVYTAIIKRSFFLGDGRKRRAFGIYESCHLQPLIAKALACVAEIEDSYPHNIVAYKVLEELDRTMLIKAGKVYVGSEAELGAFVREQLIVGQHVGFLAWALPRNPRYFLGRDGRLIFNILNADNTEEFKWTFDLHTPWRSRGVEMLRLVLETSNLDLNEALGYATPWIILIGHITSWSRGIAKVAEERFWSLLENNILSIMLRQGMVTETMIWRNNAAGSPPAFAAYLNLVFEVPSDAAREALYLQILEDFLRFHPKLARSNTRVTDSSTDWSPAGTVSMIEKFFNRLQYAHWSELWVWNSRLLAKVTDMLLFAITDSTIKFDMAGIRAAVERAFSAEICQRFKTRYPAILDAGSKAEKRRADTELERDSVKTLKTSSTGSTESTIDENL